VGALVIKGGEIGYQLRFGFAKTILLLHVSTPTNKYKRAFQKNLFGITRVHV
jgi:hypothetical protein